MFYTFYTFVSVKLHCWLLSVLNGAADDRRQCERTIMAQYIHHHRNLQEHTESCKGSVNSHQFFFSKNTGAFYLGCYHKFKTQQEAGLA